MPMMFFFFVCSCTGYFFARCARIKGDLPGLAGYLGSVLVLLSSPAATRVDPTKDPVQCTLLARVPMFIIVTVLCFYQLTWKFVQQFVNIHSLYVVVETTYTNYFCITNVP